MDFSMFSFDSRMEWDVVDEKEWKDVAAVHPWTHTDSTQFEWIQNWVNRRFVCVCSFFLSPVVTSCRSHIAESQFLCSWTHECSFRAAHINKLPEVRWICDKFSSNLLPNGGYTISSGENWCWICKEMSVSWWSFTFFLLLRQQIE